MDVNRGPPWPTNLNSGLKIHPINHTHAAVHSTLTSGLGFGGGKNQGQDGILPKEFTCVMHRFSVQQTSVAPYYQSNFIHTHTQNLTLRFVFFFFFCKYLFIWLHQVLAEACGIFSCSMRALSYGMWDLVPWPGIETRPPALGSES